MIAIRRRAELLFPRLSFILVCFSPENFTTDEIAEAPSDFAAFSKVKLIAHGNTSGGVNGKTSP